MAFQIIDDILDYTSKADVLGKESQHDVKEGIYTLPLIYALEGKPEQLTALLAKEVLSTQDVEIIKQLVCEHKGVEKAQQLAKKYTQTAFKLMEKLPENEYRKMLHEITSLMLIREY